MHMADTVRSIFRRWYVFLTGLLLTLAMGWGVYQVVPSTYEATGTAVLMPSRATVGEEGNPFLYLGGMTNAIDVMIRRTNDPQIREQLEEQFPDAELTISRDLTTDSPITVVNVQAPDPESAIALRDIGLNLAEQNLDTMQNELNLPTDLRISMRTVVVDEVAEEDTRNPLRLALVVMAGGFVATFLLTGMIDGALTRRKIKAAQRMKFTSDDEQTPPAGGNVSRRSRRREPSSVGASAQEAPAEPHRPRVSKSPQVHHSSSREPQTVSRP
ncbi:hypothetical protein AB0E44_13750 [Micrococcus terreus]|uniref:hypothetical protein n=1 Tax=Micrococcus terreus TaxID=574650 RepID=UPI003407FE60